MVTVVLTKQSGVMQGADRLHADLSAALSSDARIVLDTTDLEDVDLSFLQTVEAARRHASTNGGEIRLSQPAGERLRTALDRAGLSATFTPDDRSFWLHKG